MTTRTHKEYEKILKDKNPNIKLLSKYNGGNEYIQCRCSVCNYEWETKATRLIATTKTGCPKCAGKLKLTHDDFVNKLNSMTNNIIVIGKYINAKTPIECKCKTCGGYFYLTPSHITKMKLDKCPICNGKQIYKGINDMWTTNPELAKLLANPEDGYNYMEASGVKLNWKCQNCGNIIQAFVYNVKNEGLSCSCCSDGISYPNKFMTNILNQTNIQFETEKKFDWCKFVLNNIEKVGYYDFYFELNSQKYIIEMDGGLGHGNRIHSKSNMTIEDSIKIDNLKDELAKEHNVEVIRINATKSDYTYILNNIHNTPLDNILSNFKIDYMLAHKNSLSSNIIIASEYWNSGITKITTIAELLHVHHDTASKYLKIANKIGLCEFKSIPYKRKVHCITTNELFNSGAEAGRKYKTKNISECCLGKYSYAGKLPDGTKLIWEYVD